jgi:Mg2+ and Co2+ transporter CorA
MAETEAAASAAMTVADPLSVVVAFDFKNKKAPIIPVAEAKAAMENGTFCWIDIDVTRVEEARKLLAELGLIAPEIIEDALTREPATQIARYDDYVHLVMSGCRLAGHKFDLERVDAMMGSQFLVTLHRGQAVFLESVRKSYHADFVRFAQSPSFMLYELWDHLIDNYLAVHKAFEERVEEVQRTLIGEVDEAIFGVAS